SPYWRRRHPWSAIWARRAIGARQRGWARRGARQGTGLTIDTRWRRRGGRGGGKGNTKRSSHHPANQAPEMRLRIPKGINKTVSKVIWSSGSYLVTVYSGESRAEKAAKGRSKWPCDGCPHQATLCTSSKATRDGTTNPTAENPAPELGRVRDAPTAKELAQPAPKTQGCWC